MEKDLVCSSVHCWVSAQEPTALGYLLCCCMVWLLLKEIPENVGLNVRKLGLRDFWILPPRKSPGLRPLFCWWETCKIRLIYRKLPLTKSTKCLGWDKRPKCWGWEGRRIWSYILISTYICTLQQLVLWYKLDIPYFSESFKLFSILKVPWITHYSW